jgi:hypothetical protein
MLGAVMTVLDTTIVAVAITLGRDFDVSVATIQWVSTATRRAPSMVIPLTGWAAERFGAHAVVRVAGAVPGRLGAQWCRLVGRQPDRLPRRPGDRRRDHPPVGQTMLARGPAAHGAS